MEEQNKADITPKKTKLLLIDDEEDFCFFVQTQP